MTPAERRLARGAALVTVALATVAAPARAQEAIDASAQIEAPRWRLYAVEYARSEGVAAERLVSGADPDARVDMSWYFFVAVGHGRVILIDCGTDAFVGPRVRARRRAWAVERAVSVTDALARLGLEPAQVTDLVLTHHHWDHVGGLPHFSNARVHVHRGEWARIPERLRRPVERSERLRALSGAPESIAEGVEVREAGHHTAHQLMVEVRCADGPVVIAGDAAYLRRNIEEERPVAVTASAARNVADVRAAVQAVGAERVLPGHDPGIFERHPTPVPGVAEICR